MRRTLSPLPLEQLARAEEEEAGDQVGELGLQAVVGKADDEAHADDAEAEPHEDPADPVERDGRTSGYGFFSSAGLASSGFFSSALAGAASSSLTGLAAAARAFTVSAGILPAPEQ